MEVDRSVNVGVTAAGGKIVPGATNNMLTILKGEKTLVVHFIGFRGGETSPIRVPHPTEAEGSDDCGDETTLGGDGEEPSAEVESSFESYTGNGFTQEMW